MNFDFSEEELALKEQVRRFLESKRTLELDRSMLDGEGKAEATALWAEASELGLPGAAIPEAYGGHGFGYVALCAIAEEIGRTAAPLPMMPSIYLAAEALLLAGTEEQKQRWLPDLASGKTVGTVALGGNFTETGGRITGSAAPVPYGMSAGLVVVKGRGRENRSSLFIVDLSQPGAARSALRTIDDSCPHAELTLTDVAGNRLGDPEEAESIVDRLTARAGILIAFEQVGGSEACLDMAVAYAKERRSFGKLIGSYQAIKHKLADIYIKKELARSNAYFGAWALANDAPELELAAATARLSATDSYEFASAENIQVHGGIGYTWEADCQLHYRRAGLLSLSLGPRSEWESRLASALDNDRQV